MPILNGLLTVSGPSSSPSQARFYTKASSGLQTLSASGSFLCVQGLHELRGSATKDANVVLAPASLFWPFLPNTCRAELATALSGLKTHHEGVTPAVLLAPEESSRLNIALQLPAGMALQAAPQLQRAATLSGNQAMVTLPCHLHSFLVIPAAAAALDSLLSDLHNASSGTKEWSYAWGLGSVAPPSPALTLGKKSTQQPIPTPSIISACVAVLQVSQAVPANLLPSTSVAELSSKAIRSTSPYPGCSVMVVGSPFGCLAPHHFTNSCMQGVVSMIPGYTAAHQDTNSPAGHTLDGQCPPTSCSSAQLTQDEPVLFTIDAPCLPGMEGGLVYAAHAQHLEQHLTANHQHQTPAASQGPAVLGVLCLPVSRTSDGVQIQVALSWRHVLAALLQHPMVSATPPGIAIPKPMKRSTDMQASWGGSSSSPEARPYIHRASHGYRSHHHHHHHHHHQQQQPMAHSPPQDSLDVHVVANTTSMHARMHTPKPGVSLCGVASALPGVVLIRTQVSWATGVIISPGGLLLTNAHLLLPGAASGQKARAALRHAASMHAAQHHLKSAQPPVDATQDAALCRCDTCSTVCDEDDLTAAVAGSTGCITRQHCRFRPGLGTSSRAHIHRRPTSASCMVRMGGTGPHVRWCAAHVLYIFTNHLDLAVLQLQLHSDSGHDTGLHHLQLAEELAGAAACAGGGVPACSPGRTQHIIPAPAAAPPAPHVCPSRAGAGACGSQRVFVVGHGLVGPAAGWPAAVTGGNVAQMVHAHGQPCMMITTATVHAGASGGAVLDQEGKLVGLVTSNAKHASGHTLPNLNFCIPAAALQPVVAALLRHEARRGEACRHVHTSATDWTSSLHVFFDVHASRQQLREELEGLDLHDEAAHKVWNLEGPPPAPPWPSAAHAQALQLPSKL